MDKIRSQPIAPQPTSSACSPAPSPIRSSSWLPARADTRAEYVPYRMLEVEAAANAVYAWAAAQILTRRLPEERPSDPAEYAAAVHQEHQTLRHDAHHKLMQAFLDPEIFDGAVTITRTPAATTNRQRRLIENERR